MQLSRRTFIGSSLAAGLAAAAEATGTHWLLSARDPLRLGMLDLGQGSADYLNLFAMIPGAHVAAVVAHRRHDRTRDAVEQLRRLDQPRPTLYSGAAELLQDSSLDAVLFPGSPSLETAEAFLSAGVPCFADLPPRTPIPNSQTFSYVRRFLQPSGTIRFRLDDLTYPYSHEHVRAWLNRSAALRTSAVLTLPLITDLHRSRTATIVALSSLLSASLLSPAELLVWAVDRSPQERESVGEKRIDLPSNPHGLEHLTLAALGPCPNSSDLLIRHRYGSMNLTIHGCLNPRSSLESAMRFLRDVRHPEGTEYGDTLNAVIAGLLVDRSC